MTTTKAIVHVDVWKKIRQKAVDAPATITDSDLEIIKEFESTKAVDEVRRRRYLAIHDPPPTPEQEAARELNLKRLPPPAPTPVQTFRAIREEETLEDYLKAHESLNAPVWLVESLHLVVKDFLKSMNDKNIERNARLDVLAKRITDLETSGGSPSVKWVGVFTHGKTYDSGGLVTHRGGLWLSLIDNTGTAPGDDAPGIWKLIVKSGGYNH
jgi:hypothetical protein